MFGRISRRDLCRALEPVVHVPRRERLLFFFFGDSTTRRIPNVLRIHVRVINSTPLALRCLPVFLSFLARTDVFQYSELHWFHLGSLPKLLRRRRSLFLSLLSLCFFVKSYVSIDACIWVSFYAFESPYGVLRAGEYYADVTIISNATDIPFPLSFSGHAARCSTDILAKSQSFIKLLINQSLLIST